MSSLARRATFDNIEVILTYLGRMNREMANYCVAEISRLAKAGKGDKTILEHTEYTQWQITHRIAS
jgi:hypothetical protein